ncbi:MAG: nicotinamide mononucleotide transporter [Nanoarchaeota archaeon]
MEKKNKFYTRHVIEKELRHHVIEWLATVLSLTGAVLVALKYKDGYPVWIIANILWVSFSLKHKHYGLLFLSVSYLIINIIGIINWE